LKQFYDKGNVNTKNKIAMKFPNRLIKKGEADQAIVKAIQKRLNELGCGPIGLDGDFGLKTFQAVKLFQSRFSDINGNPLKIDGIIGAVSWAILFGESSVPSTTPTLNPLFKKVLEIASGEVGTMENPIGSNAGVRVEEYLASVDLGKGFAWCVAFLYFCFEKASQELHGINPLVKTAGVLDLWARAKCRKIVTPDFVNNPSLIKPGYIFIISTGNGHGHTGIVESVEGGFLTTIEGNTNDTGSPEGTGVFRRVKKRKINTINLGFLDFSA
jgi:CHAP domain/Putative peptidoglycan binding domain